MLSKHESIEPDEYLSPRSLDEALDYYGRFSEESVIVAGGTFVYELSKRGLISRRKLIDISDLGLDYVRKEQDTILIGAMTPLTKLLDYDEFTGKSLRYNALTECIDRFQPHQVRNVATVGGELCSGVPAFDLPPVLLAFDAKVKIRKLDGERTLPLSQFFLGYFEIALQPGEILTEITLPVCPDGTGSAFEKFERTSVDLATVNVAVRLRAQNGKCLDSRIWLGAVENTPVRAPKSEEILRGQTIGDQIFAKAAESVSKEVNPSDSLTGSAEYKKHLCSVLTKRALICAAEQIQR